MYKIQIFKNTNVTNVAQFPSQQECLDWLSYHESINSFGKPEHQVELLDSQNKSFDPPQYETILAEYTYEIIDVTSEIQLEIAKQNRIEAGKIARETCLKVLDMVAGYNLERELTIPQVSSMTTTLGQPMLALQAGRPGLAKQLIQTIVADEIVTQDMIDSALELLSNY